MNDELDTSSMISISGPDNVEIIDILNPDKGTSSGNSFLTKASSLKEALDVYCAHFNSSYRLYDDLIEPIKITEENPKYFYYTSADPSRSEIVVDIHVIRNKTGEEVCPKQKLDFELYPGDRVRIGILVC